MVEHFNGEREREREGGGTDAFPRLCLFAFRAVAASMIACGSVICKRDKRCTRMCKNVFRFSMVDREFFFFFFGKSAMKEYRFDKTG